ncbi:GT2 family glycosyltransferase [Winogradskyella wandonensis]|uniref:GT2 family glycosyltransferase n=1 Tax=Winogradskyella wandonensis TaxID=1442586 RepID=A0A4R1KUF0_9FLAO|nr:glycosyltransferase family 2 protein [Winogradskyella wandonensis]TCK68828.1 GT2 family glycosyltransferase [Winogradskyella wandonensis]
MTGNTYIIIVTYNGMHWLLKCLKSCAPFQVIVVDNNSNDDTINFIEENFPEIIILPQNKNLGFGAANNVGISHALNLGADFVFLLNQDAYLKPNAIKKLIEVYSKNTDFGILSPIHLNGDGKKLDDDFLKYLSANNELLYDALKTSFSKEIYEVPFVNAAAWLIPRAALEKVGGFDPIFFHYGEDVNYCQRVMYHDFKIGIVPNTYVLHDRKKSEKQKVISGTKNLVYYKRSYLQRFADINVRIEKDILKLKKHQIKLVLKNVVKLNFTKALVELKKYNLLRRLLPVITKSREKNRNEGLHYLDSKQNI